MNPGLSQLGSQLVAIWKQLGLNQRISIAAGGLGVFGALVALALWSSRADYTLLYGRLDETEAGKVVAALDEAKVSYQVRGTGSVYVPSDKVYSVRMQLASKGIPRGEGVGLEIFDKPNFGISDFVQIVNHTRAIQGELARTISQLDAVESARVFIVRPETRFLLDSQRKPTASVFVRLKGHGELGSAGVNSIRFIVANAVEGLLANNVAIVDQRGNVLSENQDNDSLGAISGNQLTARRNYEQYLARKAERMLQEVLGPGQAVVGVAAEINWDSVTRYEEKFDPEGQVIRTSSVNDETLDSTTATGGGVAGTGSNSNTDTNATTTSSSAPVNNSRTKKKITDNQYEINRTISSLNQAGGGLKRLSASVFVAQRFEGTGAERKAVPRAPEEIQKLRRLVQNAVGIVESDPTRRDEIVVEEMVFNDQTGRELTQQFEKQERHQLWVDLAQKLIYPALGLGLVFFFWRSFKRTRTDDLPMGLPLGELAGSGNGNGNGNGHPLGAAAGAAAYRRNDPGIVTVEVLNQLIRENPSNMTQAVRNWLGRSKPVK